MVVEWVGLVLDQDLDLNLGRGQGRGPSHGRRMSRDLRRLPGMTLETRRKILSWVVVVVAVVV
jgi:hypothetical protein